MKKRFCFEQVFGFEDGDAREHGEVSFAWFVCFVLGGDDLM